MKKDKQLTEYSILSKQNILPKLPNNRLNALKEEKFLTKRIFERLSENMHYEIFKFLNRKELLELRATNLGGFQLTSNKILRSRIRNYFHKLQPYMIEKNKIYTSNLELCHRLIELLFEQTGRKVLDFDEIGCKDEWINTDILTSIMKLHPDIEGINLEYSQISSQGIKDLVESFQYVNNLRMLNMNNVIKLKYDYNTYAHMKEVNTKLLLFANNLKYLNNLEILHFDGNCVQEEGLQIVAKEFHHLSKLHSLYFSENKMNIYGQHSTNNLGVMLKAIPNIRILDLGGNFIRAGITAVAESLKFIPLLESLNLSCNYLESLELLTQNLKFLPNLRVLILDHNKIMETEIVNLVEAFKHIPKLMELNLGSNSIGLIGTEVLADGFKFLFNLEKLHLGNILFGQRGGQAIGENIKYLPNLKFMDLSMNSIGSISLVIMAQYFENIPKLEIFYLYNNGIGEDGFNALTQQLKYLPKLHTLDLSHNRMSKKQLQDMKNIYPKIRKILA